MRRALFVIREIVAVLLYIPVILLLAVSYIGFVLVVATDEGLNALRRRIHWLREARA